MHEQVLLVRVIHYKPVVLKFIKKLQFPSISRLPLIYYDRFLRLLFKFILLDHVHPLILIIHYNILYYGIYRVDGDGYGHILYYIIE